MSEQPSNFIGGIDILENSQLSGWAANKADATPLEVGVYCGEKLIGQGIADKFRSDLKDADIHEGKHSFLIDINGDELVHGEVITLKEFTSSVAITTNKFEVNLLGQQFHLTVKYINGTELKYILQSDKPIGDKTLVVFSDNKEVCRKAINTNQTTHEENIWLPSSIMDNKRHLLEIGIKGYPKKISATYAKLKPFVTPWQFLKESVKTPGFMSLPAQADKRYESLTHQLRVINDGVSGQTLHDVMTVHQVVTESYENRTKFPAFSLPEFVEPKVSVIVPAYNKFNLTYHCIASIALAYNKTSYEVILADDCSTDETAEAETIIDNLVVSRNEENLRFLKSCNRATEIARGEYIIFLNNDTEVSSFWIDELIEQHEKDATVGLTGSKLLNLDGSLQEAGGTVWGNGEPWNVGRDANPLQPEFNYTREVDYLTGAAMCIPKAIWEQVGRFSEELAPCYYEDTDLAFKVREAGLKTLYVPTSEVVHFEGQSHGTDVTKGLKRYQVVNEKTFRSKWFSAFKHNGKPSQERLHLIKDQNIDQRVLVIDYASPQPNKDAGSYAAIQEIKLIQALGFKVTFVPENLAHMGKYTVALQKMGVEVLYSPFYLSMQELLERRLDEMDAVYITRYYIAERYIDQIKEAGKPVLFNNADLHFLREMRTALKNGRDEEMLENAMQTREHELAVCEKSDAILTYNATEQAVITSHILEAEKLHITPWVLEQKNPGPAFDSRQGVAFLGGFNHLPNVEAVEFIVEQISPILAKARPDIVINIFGSNMPESVKALENDNVKMIGFAEHLDDVYHNHRVFIAPLLSGAGIKGKVLESMAYGLPTVLSEIAAEGTGLTHNISTLIADKPEEWVEAIIKLYDDSALWERFAQNELALVESQYSFDYGVKAFKEIFASVGLYSTR